jgi:uncharacterized membrane protein
MSEKTPDVKEPLATFGQRAKAGLLPDFLVPILLMISGGILIGIASDAFTIVGGVVCQLAAVISFIATFIFLPYKRRGQSNGKMRQHITVKKIVDKEKWTLRELGEGDIGMIIGRAIVNWIEVLFIIPTLLSFLMVSSSNNNQTLTDRLFGTVVVQIDPEEYAIKKDGEEEVVKDDNICDACGEPIKKNAKFCAGCGAEKTVSKKTTTTKKTTTKTTRVEGENNTLAMISKFVFIGGFIFPILYLFLQFIASVLETVWFSIIAWGGIWLPNLQPFYKALNAFGIISYICFFIVTGAIILLALQYSEKTQTNLFVSGGTFGAFTIFWIVANEANFGYRLFAFFGLGSVGISVGRVIFWILAVSAFIVSIFFFNNYLKQANEEHDQNIPTFKGQIPLIVFIALRFIVFLIGVIAVPTDAFGATIYYLQKLFVWMALITMMIMFIGLAIRALKLNTKKIPAKS